MIDLEGIAHALGGASRKANGGYVARCPVHDDSTASLSIDVKDGKLVVKCFAGCNQADVVAALKSRGLWSEKERQEKTKRRIVAKYDYRNADGKLIFQVLRYELKGFSQRRPDGKGRWIYNLDDVSPVPYNLGAVSASSCVVIAEGEKDVDRLSSIQIPATCNPMGAGKWRESYNQYLAGKRVAILADNDEPGRKHALSVAQNLHGIAAMVKIINLPGLPPKGDVSDWLDKSGNDRDKLLKIISDAPEWSPEAAEQSSPPPEKPLFISAPNLLSTKISPIYLVKNLIEKRSTVMIFGPSGHGKTFVIIDLALHVAVSRHWNGKSVDGGLVFYFTGEGFAGFPRRILAAAMHCDISPSDLSYFHVSRSLIDLSETAKIIHEIETVSISAGVSPALIIIDTLARHINGDEKDAKDVDDFLGLIERLREAFCDVVVMLIHHSGHQEKDRARGSSALKAAMDCEIQCSQGLLNFTKMKDAETPKPIEFKLVPIRIGADEDENEITSCYVEYGERSAKNKEAVLTSTEKDLLGLIKETPGILSGDLRTAYFEHRKERDPETKYATAKKAFLRALDGLISKGQIFMDGFSVMPGQGQNRDIAGTCPEGEVGHMGHTPLGVSQCPAPLSRSEIEDLNLSLEVANEG
ncbi:MAG: AAA family ATPase [Geobacteraceae bacterium]|nr:AAA family ATPase [Geobacteraceae bacterium]